MGSSCRGGSFVGSRKIGEHRARLLRDQGRSADAPALLQPVYDRFTESFDTADLNPQKTLLDALRRSSKL
jgi:hypothetical protein